MAKPPHAFPRMAYSLRHVERPPAACAVLLATLLLPLQTIAQEVDCGSPPPVANHNLRIEIEGKAELLSRYLGDASLSGQIERSRSEIFSKYPDAEVSRSNAFFEYQLCIYLKRSTLSDEEKVDRLIEIKRLLGGEDKKGDAPSDAGLAGYYTLDGHFRDSSRFANHGRGFGNVRFIDGIKGQAAYFNGRYGGVLIPSSASLNPDKELTISLWIRVEKLPTSGWSSLLFKGGPSKSTETKRNYSNREYSLFLSSGRGGLLHLAISGDNDADQSVVNVYPGSENLEKWLHFAAVVDRLRHKMDVYINGAMEGSTEDRYSTFNNGNYDLTLGWAEEQPRDFFSGAIDEVRIYRRALSRQEIGFLSKEGR